MIPILFIQFIGSSENVEEKVNLRTYFVWLKRTIFEVFLLKCSKKSIESHMFYDLGNYCIRLTLDGFMDFAAVGLKWGRS